MSDHYLLNSAIVRKRTAITAIVGMFLGVALLLTIDFMVDEAPAAPSTHISIPAPLFAIGDSVCANNGGRRDIVINKKSDVFTFICEDGMTLSDTVVRVVKK